MARDYGLHGTPEGATGMRRELTYVHRAYPPLVEQLQSYITPVTQLQSVYNGKTITYQQYARCAPARVYSIE